MTHSYARMVVMDICAANSRMRCADKDLVSRERTGDSLSGDGALGGTVVSCERKRHFKDLDRLVRRGMK